MNWLFVVCAVIGYFLGGLNGAIIWSGYFYKDDVRTCGSGNAGTTNILRTFGKKAAAIVFLFDILKGVLAVILGRAIGGTYGSYLGGFFSVIGHNFPVYFGFRGGKGIATSLAVMLTVAPIEALIAFAIGILVIFATHYVSLGSILGAFLFGFLSAFRGDDLWFRIFAVGTAVLAILRHAGNIKRLINGTERKLGK